MDQPLHSLLRRQLKRCFGEQFTLPEQWRDFVHQIDQAYRSFDGDRQMLERSLELSSQELLDANLQMRAVFQAIPDPVFRLDHHGTILDVKAGSADDLMIERQALVGKRIQDTPLKHVAHQFSEAIERVLEQNAPVSIEYSAVVHGQESYYEARLVPLLEKELVLIIRNITERKQSLRLLGAAVEQTNESIVITDAELNKPGPRILFVNSAFTKLTGYTAEEVLGQTPRILQGPRSDRAELRRLRATLERGESFIGETTNYRKDCTEIIQELQVTPLRDSTGTITHYLSIQRDITERKQAEASLRESQERLLLATKSAHIGIWDWDVLTNKLVWDSQMYGLYGLRTEDFSGAYEVWLNGVHPEDRNRSQAELNAALQGIKDFHTEFRVVWPNGEVRDIEAHAVVQRNPNGAAIRMIGVNWDVTERKRLETQLFQSQKLETVGKLAGGIAHEFNSILTAIIGQSEMLIGDLPPASPLAANAAEIAKAAVRAATLTRQLLAYGRKQVLQPETLNLNRILASVEDMIRHLMGEAVETVIVPATGLRPVRADAGQIEQVILNMAINARDAMPEGGKLILETSNVAVTTENAGSFPELKPGEYVLLQITDTGQGMSPEVKAHLFEPFYTTKEVGVGTGLGLSTCYGIVKQSGGHIAAQSEPGQGTVFKIYLPQATLPSRAHVDSEVPFADLPRGTESILLIEEDATLRTMVANLLKRLGYTIAAAANGNEALNANHQQGSVALLIANLELVQSNPSDFAQLLQAAEPQPRILFTSVYPENAPMSPDTPNNGGEILHKPFTPSALARKLREVLDRTAV